ncbi:MAG: hypothetical protein V3T33_06955 [Myxococcota bacterium]
MQDLGLFLSIAEIAGVFVGFGALISLLRDQQNEGRLAVHAVIANGLVALVAALIPVALSQYGLTGRALWGWSSGAFLLLCWAAIWGGFHNPEIRDAAKVDAKANPVLTVGFWGLLEAPLQLPLVLILLGIGATHARALYFTALVMCLVQAAFLLGRAVFSRVPSKAL